MMSGDIFIAVNYNPATFYSGINKCPNKLNRTNITEKPVPIYNQQIYKLIKWCETY